MKIGIVGLGFVGGTLQRWFATRNVDLFLYDKFKNIGSLKDVGQADVIFVAVPTPYGPNGYDDSAVAETLAGLPDGKIVVIKSTIVPQSTLRFQKQYPGKTILFNPEFLTEANAYADFIAPCRQIVGYANHAGKKAAAGILDILPFSFHTEILPSTEAELVKYFSNVFLATRVIFANQMYDICQAAGADYATVRASAVVDKRIGSSHFDVFDGGYRGYGGHCLPKDTRALIQFGRTVGAPTTFLDSLEQINGELTRESA